MRRTYPFNCAPVANLPFGSLRIVVDVAHRRDSFGSPFDGGVERHRFRAAPSERPLSRLR